MERYRDKPFLRLIDCYVLKAIGHLDPVHEVGLAKMEAGIAKAFGRSGSWDAMVAQQLEWPDTFPSKICDLWKKYERWAYENGFEPDPDQFTVEFIERNFPEFLA